MQLLYYSINHIKAAYWRVCIQSHWTKKRDVFDPLHNPDGFLKLPQS